jgi:hypothetical protein
MNSIDTTKNRPAIKDQGVSENAAAVADETLPSSNK